MNLSVKDIENKLIDEVDIYKRIDLMNSLAWELRRNNKVRAKNLSNKAHDMASEINYEKGIAESFLCIAVSLGYEKSNFEAVEKATKALSIFEKLNISDGIIKALNSLGVTYGRLGKRDKSLECYLRGLSIAKQTNNNSMLIFLLNNVGEIYKKMNKYDEALKYFFEASSCPEINSTSSYGFLLNSIGTTYLEMNNLVKALEYSEKGLNIAKQYKDKITQGHCYKNLGKIYYEIGNYEKMLSNLNEGLMLHIEDNNIFDRADILYELGSFYAETSDYAKALDYLHEALNYAERVNANSLLANIYNKLAVIYEKNCKFESSIRYYKKFIEINSELAETELEKKLEAIIADSKLQQAEKDMEIYKLKNVELKEKSEEIQKKAKLLETSYQNISIISEIGQKITSSLDIEKIMNTIYENMNSLMDATVFGIGIFDEKHQEIDYRMYIENSHRVPRFQTSINNEKSIAARCILNRKEILINDLLNDNLPYFVVTNEDDTLPRSLIYCPLIIENKVIGTITVQSYKPNSYTEQNLETMKALASYIAIAVNNSQKSEELKNTAKELIITLKNLQETQEYLINSEKMAALGQLISGIAHEINTPLGAIQASISNILEYVEHTICEKIPMLFKILDEDMQTIFIDLIKTSMYKDVALSSRDERKYKKIIDTELELLSIEQSDSLADSLVDMGIYALTENYLKLLQHPNNQLIIQASYEISGIFRNIKNMDVAIGKASKMLYALKSYSHTNQEDIPVVADITQGIETVLALYQNNLKHGTELIKNYKNIPKIKCLPDELNQVWTNLIHNALQAMDYKGILLLETDYDDRFVTVKITDSGHGIPEEIKNKIFDPFFTTKRQGEGSGLGLGIVKKIINKHKGYIYVDSIPHRTTFTVKLPITL